MNNKDSQLLFVIAIFDSGVHQGYWYDDESDLMEKIIDATIHDSRKSAEKSLGDIPRKYDARIFSLQLSPEDPPCVSPDHIRTEDIPGFLRQGNSR